SVGQYYAFVVAKSENDSLLDSYAGVGYSFSIERKNQILSANYVNGTIEVTCTENVCVFDVFVDGEIVGQFEVVGRGIMTAEKICQILKIVLFKLSLLQMVMSMKVI
ncbi:MAG: hypothetical protein MJ152_04560, partial [Clostridia bacterium]|nr:hypothetical protein [Clostridia bacterium]